MVRMSATTARTSAAAIWAKREREADPLWDDESGPSWTKQYSGGQKLRQYAAGSFPDISES
jgi:hypothetical protein